MRVSASFLSPEEIGDLHEATLTVLSETGVRFAHEGALEIFKKKGARVDGDRVFIDEPLLKEALQSAPGSFTLHGREKEDDVIVGSGRPVFAPASGPVYVKRGAEKRPATRQDFIDLLKLSQSSAVLGVTNYIVVEPQDLDESRRKMFQVAAALRYSTKPLVGMTMGQGRTAQSFRLLRDFYGSLDDHRMLGIISPISPLAYDRGMLEHAIAYGRAGQPLMFASCSQPGFTGPVTLAGTAVVDNAQQLAGIVFSQLCREGLPVIYGSTSTSCDMRYASPAIGSPEASLLAIATAELAGFYGLPSRSGGALTDAKAPDMQAGLESMMVALSTAMARVDFVLHACGILDSFNTVSFEKFVIDETTAAMVERFVAGFEIDEEKLATGVIGKVGPQGMYLAENHTARFHRSELFIPALFSRESYLNWEKGGSPTLEERARAAVAERLDSYVAPPLSPAQESILAEYLL